MLIPAVVHGFLPDNCVVYRIAKFLSFMPTTPFYVVNAFANHPFGGNPAGVFPVAKGLTEELMQSIAKQLNLVESVFVLPSTEADFELRYFTPHNELPIAGHPTIATWFALANQMHIDVSVRRIFRQKTKRGIQNIHFELSSSEMRILMQQPSPKFLGVLPNKARVAEVFSLVESDLLPNLPVEALDTGLGHIVFGVRSLGTLMRVRRNIELLKNLCSEFRVSEAQIYCEETYDSDLNFHTRNICPREGMEDPACGVGNSALLAYLMRNAVVNSDFSEIQVEQGHCENMPSVIFVRGQRDANSDLNLTLGGTGIMMVKGEFSY